MFASVIALLLASGCASVDPKPDIDRASAAVTERTGVKPGWNAPWDASPPVWDARADLDSATAVLLALKQNPVIRADLETIAAARADLAQSGLLPNPVLNFGLGFPIAGAADGTSISLSLVQSLVALWQRDDRVAAAGLDLDERVLGVSDAALRLVAATRSEHVRIVIAQREVELQDSLLASVDKSIELTKRRMGAGEASRLDANRVQLLLLDAADEAAQSRTDLAVLKRQFLLTLGMAGASAEWKAADVLPASVPGGALAAERAPTEQQVVQLALAQRLDAAAARAAADAALKRAGLVRKGRIGQLDAGVDFERDDEGNESVGPEISVEIPIFDTGDARIAKAGAEARAAVAHERAVSGAAVAEAREAYQRVKSDIAALARLSEQVALASTNLQLGQSAFDAGLTDLTALLDVQRDYTRAQIKLLSAQERAALDLIELERAVGGRLGE